MEKLHLSLLPYVKSVTLYKVVFVHIISCTCRFETSTCIVLLGRLNTSSCHMCNTSTDCRECLHMSRSSSLNQISPKTSRHQQSTSHHITAFKVTSYKFQNNDWKQNNIAKKYSIPYHWVAPDVTAAAVV